MQKRFGTGSLRQVYLPRQMTLIGTVSDNPVQQLRRPDLLIDADVQSYKKGRITGQLVVHENGSTTLVVPRNIDCPSDVSEMLRLPGNVIPSDQKSFAAISGRSKWLTPEAVDVSCLSQGELQRRCSEVVESWSGQFYFREEHRVGNALVQKGLRAPQIGAVYSTLGYWKSKSGVGTVVMPTGTGKTETMIALLVKERIKRLLVVVPTSALREQIVEKFLTFGVLKGAGVVGDSAAYPIVGMLEHRLLDIQEVDALFGCCNVVVATMQAVSQCEEAAQVRMAELSSHLFIDEAHHVPARTWDSFRRLFADKVVLQFTATPFRADGRPVSGNMVFEYPLRKAQEEGYFQPIEFVPIRGFGRKQVDIEIAKAAVRRLDADLQAGYNHVVMARVQNIARAAEVFEAYQLYGSTHKPVQIHSDMGKTAKQDALQQIQNGTSRIVVCVNMLGEGFDLPELKIAALHDMHKSLAITLQFTGRFTRTRSDIGNATMIARYPDDSVQQALRNLYAEDADWNLLLPPLSETATKRQAERSKFLENFEELPSEIPLQNVFPKMSTVVFRSEGANWDPFRMVDALGEASIYAGPLVNVQDRVALVITREFEDISWGAIKDIYNVTWHLYLTHWDEENKLLYINSSNNDGVHRDLAKAVAGDDVEIIRGEQVFRAMHGINRLLLMNLGLNSVLSRAVRFTMFVGPDIREGLAQAIAQNKTKSNIFGRGYENGEPVSIGCSYKGRIWSFEAADDISAWVNWCHWIGNKLLDGTILVEKVLDDAMVPMEVDARPEMMPLSIDWSPLIFDRSEDSVFIIMGGKSTPIFDVGIELVDYSRTGPIRFRIFTDTDDAVYEVQFHKHSVTYAHVGGSDASVRFGGRGQARSLGKWFEESPPIIQFESRSYLEYNVLLCPNNEPLCPFNRDNINTWSWKGVNIKRESQKIHKYHDSIQRRVIETLIDPSHDPDYDIVFDDDDSGEAADVVALKIVGETLVVHLFHCKFSGENKPGARVEDLYAVCGQAQRSVIWRRENAHRLIHHLRCREESRLEKHPGISRFEKGDLSRLDYIASRASLLIPNFKIFIVQPGLSAKNADVSQLELLASTELYLQETYSVPFGVIASP